MNNWAAEAAKRIRAEMENPNRPFPYITEKRMEAIILECVGLSMAADVMEDAGSKLREAVDIISGHQWDEKEQACACGWKPFARGHRMSHLHIEQPLFDDKPHAWIQWKGTDACADIYCRCGEHLHFDGYFMYFLRCPKCKTVWEFGTHIMMYEVKDNRADGARIEEAQAE